MGRIGIHPFEESELPFIGVTLGCTWDDEHGLGVLMYGATPLEVGGADTATTRWIAEKHAREL